MIEKSKKKETDELSEEEKIHRRLFWLRIVSAVLGLAFLSLCALLVRELSGFASQAAPRAQGPAVIGEAHASLKIAVAAIPNAQVGLTIAIVVLFLLFAAAQIWIHRVKKRGNL